MFKMKCLPRLYKEQKGVCPWCGYTMILDHQNSNVDVIATVDHLTPKVEGVTRPTRFKIAAHRACNNSRGHSVTITDQVKKQIHKSAIQLGLTLDRTTANHIWSQKIKQAFLVSGLNPISPFRKNSEKHN